MHDDERAARRRHVGLVALLGAMAFLPAATTDMYLPSLPEVARDLDASEAAVQLTISWVLVGGSLGQLLIGPLSDRWGRRRPAVAGLAAFVVVGLACMAAGSIGQLVPLRLLHGFVAAAATVVAVAVIGDRWRGAEAARLLSRLWLAIAVAPVLAPLLGTVVADAWGWRAVFGVLAAMGAVLAVVVLRALPETLPPERRLGAGLGASLRSYAGVLRDRQFLAYAILPGLGLAVIMSYVTGSSFVFQTELGLSPQQYALVFGLGATAMGVGSQVNAALVARVGPARLLAVGLLGTVLATTALLVVAAGGYGGVVGLLVPVWVTVGLLSGVIANASALALERHPDRSGTAAAVIGALQGALGGLVSPLVGVVGGRAVHMAAVMLGAALAAALVLAAGTPALRTAVPGRSGRGTCTGRVIRRRVLVHGFVQGVGYRWSCAREAERLGLTGWVRNLDDGDVELAAEGPADAVDALVAWARRGPSAALVTSLDVVDEPPEGARRFAVR